MLGVANIVDGFQSGKRTLPSGVAEATDIGLGGDGSVGRSWMFSHEGFQKM